MPGTGEAVAVNTFQHWLWRSEGTGRRVPMCSGLCPFAPASWHPTLVIQLGICTLLLAYHGQLDFVEPGGVQPSGPWPSRINVCGSEGEVITGDACRPHWGAWI